MPEAKEMKKEFLQKFKEDYLESYESTAGAIDTAAEFITSYMPDSYSFLHEAIVKAIDEAIKQDEYLCDDASYGFGNGRCDSYQEFIKNNKQGVDNMNAQEAYNKIKAYDKKVKDNEKQKREKYISRIKTCEEKIKELEPRIKQLIEIGGMLIDSDNIDEKEFETEAIKHRVGFYKCTRHDNTYKYLGIRNGGANGNIDFITDGSIVKGLWFDSRNECPRKPGLYDYEKFLENFDEFEKKVFDFINNL